MIIADVVLRGAGSMLRQRLEKGLLTGQLDGDKARRMVEKPRHGQHAGFVGGEPACHALARRAGGGRRRAGGQRCCMTAASGWRRNAARASRPTATRAGNPDRSLFLCALDLQGAVGCKRSLMGDTSHLHRSTRSTAGGLCSFPVLALPAAGQDERCRRCCLPGTARSGCSVLGPPTSPAARPERSTECIITSSPPNASIG